MSVPVDHITLINAYSQKAKILLDSKKKLSREDRIEMATFLAIATECMRLCTEE